MSWESIWASMSWDNSVTQTEVSSKSSGGPALERNTKEAVFHLVFSKHMLTRPAHSAKPGPNATSSVRRSAHTHNHSHIGFTNRLFIERSKWSNPFKASLLQLADERKSGFVCNRIVHPKCGNSLILSYMSRCLCNMKLNDNWVDQVNVSKIFKLNNPRAFRITIGTMSWSKSYSTAFTVIYWPTDAREQQWHWFTAQHLQLNTKSVFVIHQPTCAY